MTELKKNEIYKAEIDGWSSDGAGVCHIGGRAVFVPETIPGELWQIKMLKVTSSAAYAKGMELLTPSPLRAEPGCPYFGKCGGCDTWHMSYPAEAKFKLGKVNDALRHIGRQDFEVTELIPCEEAQRYRNKGIYAVANTGNGVKYGFYRERSHDLIPVEGCLIQNELADRAARCLTEWMTANGVPAYDELTGKGTVRHIFIRRAVHTADAVACIVSARGFGAMTENMVRSLCKACPELSGIVLNINKTRGNAILAGDFHTLYGSEIMRDILCGFEFEIAPQAFFQINPPQAEKLYDKAVQYAGLTGNETVLELYCGAGTISLCLAKGAKQVIGAEIVPEAIENAKGNAEKNGVKNTEFICADAGHAAQILSDRGLRPDVVVVDPPRKGMAEEAVTAVAGMNPAKIVYVSCNPATLARDIQRFSALGYTLDSAAAVDMFPRTAHVETVCLMSRICGND